MDVCPLEIKNIICDNVLYITDLRHFGRTCKLFNNICNPKIINLEDTYIKKYSNCSFSNNIKKYSTSKFTIEIILDGYYEYLNDAYYVNDNKFMCPLLAFVGNFELLKYANSKSCPLGKYTILCAAYGGDTNILDWIYENVNRKIFVSKYECIINNACTNNKTNICDWVKNKNYGLCDIMFISAIYNDNYDIIVWMKNNNIEIRYNFIETVCKNDKVKIFELLYDLQYINDIVTDVLLYGSVNILKWLLDNKHINKNNLCLSKVSNGKLDMILFCVDNGISIDNDIYKSVIFGNRIDIFVWLHNNGYKMDSCLYDHMVKWKAKKIISFCIENKMLTYDDVFDKALKSNNVVVLKWALKNYKFNTKINLNNLKLCDGILILLLKYDLIILDDNYLKLLSVELKYIKKILEHPIQLPRWNICMNKKMILKMDNDDVDQPNRLLYVDDKDEINYDKNTNIYHKIENVIGCNLDCENKCWYYYLVLKDNRNNDVIQFCNENIDKCSIHRIFNIKNKYV